MLKNEENKEELSNLWKTFGIETAAGKMLYKMYNQGKDFKKKINYPKVLSKDFKSVLVDDWTIIWFFKDD